ncbi:ferritin-like domain-containing protein, partial [Chromobacterium piscinae]
GALLHAIAHIEFNAVNLALDAAWRFRDMPDGFVDDWLRVAAEEAGHFRLLQGRLAELGFSYGDFPAHDGLWTMCRKTDHDAMIRMALVPRVLEARGLDVTPGIQRRLAGIGDHASVAVLDIILRDEIGHVQIGNRWF